LKKIFFNYVARILQIKLESVVSRKVLNSHLSYEANRNASSGFKKSLNKISHNNICNADLNDKPVHLLNTQVNNFKDKYKHQNGNENGLALKYESSNCEKGLLKHSNDNEIANNLNLFPSEKIYSPKINNNFFINQMKAVVSPSHKIACMCNCSTHSSSITQSSASSPQFNQRFTHNMISIPTIKINNSTQINNIKKSLDSSNNRDYRENESLQKIDYKNFNPHYVRYSDLEKTIKNHFEDFIVKLKNAIEISEMRLIENEKREVIQNEWSDLAMILDRLLFYFLSSLTIITTTFIFLNSPHTFESW
jgi:hypothetical protein